MAGRKHDRTPRPDAAARRQQAVATQAGRAQRAAATRQEAKASERSATANRARTHDWKESEKRTERSALPGSTREEREAQWKAEKARDEAALSDRWQELSPREERAAKEAYANFHKRIASAVASIELDTQRAVMASQIEGQTRDERPTTTLDQAHRALREQLRGARREVGQARSAERGQTGDAIRTLEEALERRLSRVDELVERVQQGKALETDHGRQRSASQDRAGKQQSAREREEAALQRRWRELTPQQERDLKAAYRPFRTVAEAEQKKLDQTASSARQAQAIRNELANEKRGARRDVAQARRQSARGDHQRSLQKLEDALAARAQRVKRAVEQALSATRDERAETGHDRSGNRERTSHHAERREGARHAGPSTSREQRRQASQAQDEVALRRRWEDLSPQHEKALKDAYRTFQQEAKAAREKLDQASRMDRNREGNRINAPHEELERLEQAGRRQVAEARHALGNPETADPAERAKLERGLQETVQRMRRIAEEAALEKAQSNEAAASQSRREQQVREGADAQQRRRSPPEQARQSLRADMTKVVTRANEARERIARDLDELRRLQGALTEQKLEADSTRASRALREEREHRREELERTTDALQKIDQRLDGALEALTERGQQELQRNAASERQQRSLREHVDGATSEIDQAIRQLESARAQARRTREYAAFDQLVKEVRDELAEHGIDLEAQRAVADAKRLYAQEARERVRNAETLDVDLLVQQHKHRNAILRAEELPSEDMQSAHIAQQFLSRANPERVVNAREALAILLPPDVHSAVDRRWKQELQRLRQGRDEITVGEWLDINARCWERHLNDDLKAIGHRELEPAEIGTMNYVLFHELVVRSGLDLDEPLRLERLA